MTDMLLPLMRRLLFVSTLVITGAAVALSLVGYLAGRQQIFGAQPDLVVIILSALIVLLAYAVGAFVIERVMRPTNDAVNEVAESARRLALGELNVTFTPQTQEEIGHLASAFRLMAEELRSRLEELEAARNQLAVILRTMANGLIVTDDQGSVILANEFAGRILGFDPNSAPGTSFATLVRDHDLDRIWRSTIKNGESIVEFVRAGPENRQLRVTSTLVRYRSQLRAVLLFVDITELRRLESVRRDFVTNVSHELRTPLASVKALVETLQDGALDEPEVARRFLDRVNIEVDRLAQLVSELLELSRIESGQVSLQREPVEVEQLVRNAVSRLQAQAERQGISLFAEIDEPAIADADPGRIEQVLVNLIHNAIKFTEPNGSIRVRSHAPKGGWLKLSVTDTGVGIPQEDLPRVFERFYKTDKSRSSGGTGLGLAIAKHIVRAHGGDIWAESAVGSGTTFWFTLPIAAVVAADAAPDD